MRVIFFEILYVKDFKRILLNLFILTLTSSLTLSCSESKSNQSIDKESLFNICSPCEFDASRNKINKGIGEWPTYSKGDLVKVNNLTKLKYNQPEYAFPNIYWKIEPWWTNYGVDPWSDFPYWGDEYVQPNHKFKDCVDDSRRWECGYSFVVKIPDDYSKNNNYPLVIFLHGSVNSTAESFVGREKTRNSFYYSDKDPYIYAAPIKLEIDWDPIKIQDLIENIKENISIDEDRIYLTGLSMGGRGTFIVASELSTTFAALMPLSPHHDPYNYVKLSENVKHLPIWMSHGDVDQISSYPIAKTMADILLNSGANIKFRTEKGVGHWGWNNIYKDSTIIKWLMSWKKLK